MTTQPPPPDREQVAQFDIARTTIAPGLTAGLIAALLVPMLAVAAIQVATGGFRAAARALPGPSELAATRRTQGWFAANRLLTDGLHRFELDLEETSPVLTATQPSAQWVMTTLLATGNTRVAVGRDGWLFFRPDVDHLTGPAFLSPARRAPLGGLVRPGAGARADLLDEFAAFAELQSYGVHLVVLVVPSKAAIHPEKLAPALRGAAPLGNPSLPAFAQHLRESGITLLDPSALLAGAARDSGVAQYLATDTHWTPAAMDRVAAITAEALGPHLSPPSPAATTAPPLYQRQPATAQNIGDIARMLRLPQEHRLYPPEVVTIARVVDRDGAPWEPDPNAEVLVLGDSFTQLYSTASMGWGSSAGFAEQLAFHLQRPVDRIAINAGGALRALTDELAAGRNRLDGKRVVLYELAARLLTTAAEAEP